MAYSGSIDLISGIRAKNNGSFPLVDAKDVYVNDEYRLDAYLAQLGGGGILETTWAALKAKKDAGELSPGQQYRITDYVATVASGGDAQSMNTPFDLIVVADAVNKLNELARAVRHNGDANFPSATKFEAWKVWYSIDNDADRFAWADTTNGKGVVYRLIDEFNNDVPYDFKGIEYGGAGVKTLDTGGGADGSIEGGFYNVSIGRTVDAEGKQILNAVIFSGAFQNVIVECGCAYLKVDNATAGTMGNITVSSGLKGASYSDSKTIRLTASNMAYHTTYVPRDSQSVEV